MARNARIKPRKQASQARSRATVAALVEATARVLVRDGYDQASTNRIAEVAGVSIGSLYQYFPSKEALVVAVIERHRREIMRVVRRAMADVETLPIKPAVRRLVAAAVDGHRVNPQLHRVLAEHTPHLAGAPNLEAFNAEAHALFQAFLDRHREELRPVDTALAAFVCVTSIEGITHTAVVHRPDVLSDDALDALVDEATQLVLRYLL